MSISKLLAISSAPISTSDGVNLPNSNFGGFAQELKSLLKERNGFYAFESALHFFPSGNVPGEIDLESWNAKSLWTGHYKEMASGHLFFAEDIFGDQFCYANSEICFFNAETAELTPMAKNLNEWSKVLLENFNSYTGHGLAREWQSINGPIGKNQRLVPKIPFVLDPKYEASNLYAMDSVKCMRLRASLAVQIRDLPDGSAIQYVVE